jgi:translation initiation factor 2B subunit (eIF-2B alpha/beta/delta family)
MFAKLQSLFTSANCEALRVALEEARQMVLSHWNQIEVLTSEIESLKDRLSDECNSVTLLIDKVEQAKFEMKQQRKRIADALGDALSLANLDIPDIIANKTSIATLKRTVTNHRLAIEAVKRVLDSIAKDPA